MGIQFCEKLSRGTTLSGSVWYMFNFLLHRDDPKAELVYIILQELLLCVAVVRCFPSER